MKTIEEDIELALMWASPAKLLEPPGEGEGWRHTCYRLAMEVRRLQQEAEDARFEALERDEKA